MANGVPAIAISMDERLHNVYTEVGSLDYYFWADDCELKTKLVCGLESLCTNSQTIAESLKKHHSSYVSRFEKMGEFLLKYLEDGERKRVS